MKIATYVTNKTVLSTVPFIAEHPVAIVLLFVTSVCLCFWYFLNVSSGILARPRPRSSSCGSLQ